MAVSALVLLYAPRSELSARFTPILEARFGEASAGVTGDGGKGDWRSWAELEEVIHQRGWKRGYRWRRTALFDAIPSTTLLCALFLLPRFVRALRQLSDK